MTIIKTLVLVTFATVASPSIHAQINVDYDSPPESEAELFANSSAVVRARVVGSRSERPEQGPAMTAYSLRVLEVLKSDGNVNLDSLIDVYRFGEHKAKKVEADFAEFEMNDELVLFLERDRNGRYMPIFGPGGAFRLRDGRTEAFATDAAVSRRHAGRSSESFLGEMRKLKR